MSRWWRAYDEAVDDPKLCLLTDKQHRAWFNLCCITSQNGGKLPAIAAVAFKLRMTADKAKGIISELVALGLVDMTGDIAAPHNWGGRQFQSDTSTDRVKRFRKQQRNVSSAVSETPPETEQKQITETDTEAIASDASVPRDIRADLFGHGLRTLAQITGKTPDSCRSLVGRWLKSVDDEAVQVLGAIDDAARNRVADPVAWINKSLKPNGFGKANGTNRKDAFAAALDDLQRAAESGRISAPGGPTDALLPDRRSA